MEGAYSPVRDELSASQAETTKKHGRTSPFTKHFLPAAVAQRDEDAGRVMLTGESPAGATASIRESLHSTTLTITPVETVSVDRVISRLHSVRSSMKEHTDTNEALLHTLAERIAAGQRAGKSGLSEAMEALERQRQETMEARAEAKRNQESLVISQHELKRALAEKAVLEPVKEALVDCESQLAAERLMRADLQTHLDSVSSELKHARAKIQSQECDLEIMCEDLAEAEGTLEITRSTLKLMQKESATHQRERVAEEAAVTLMEEAQESMERKMRCLSDQLAAHVISGQEQRRRNHLLQQQLVDALAHSYRVESELSSSNVKFLASEDYNTQLLSEMQSRGVTVSELRGQMEAVMLDFHAAQSRIADLEMQCSQMQGQMVQAEAALKQSHHELSENTIALGRIFDVACADTPQEQQSSASQASSVCEVIRTLRQQIGTLQQVQARSLFELARRSEAEKQRLGATYAAMSQLVSELVSMGKDLQTERGCVGSMGTQYGQLQTEHHKMEQKLMHTINALTQSHEHLSTSAKTVEKKLQQSDLKVKHLQSALESTKQTLSSNDAQLKEGRDLLKNLGVQFDLSVRQADQWKEKYNWKNEEWEAVRDELKGMRRDLAKREQEQSDCKAIIAQMHRTVCGKFKKTGIGIKLRVDRPDHSSDRTISVDGMIPGGPADASGKIEVGDHILAINGTEPSSMSEDVIRSMIAGPVGSTVVLRVMSIAKNTEFEITLVRKAPTAEKQTSAGQGTEVIDCAHALFIEMQQLSIKDAMTSSELEVQKISVANMQENSTTLQADLDNFGVIVTHLRKQIEELEQELVVAQTASKCMQRKVAGLLQERETETKQLANANEKISRLSTQFEESRRELQEECRRHQLAAKENAGIVADLKSCVSTRDSQASLLKLEIERLKGESTHHRMESETVKKQILLLRDTHEELKGMLVQARGENNRLLEHLETEKRQAEMMESRLTIALAGSQRLDREKAGVSSNLAELEQKYEDALQHTQDMLEKMEEAQQELKGQYAEITKLMTEKQQLEESRDEANASLEQALSEIEAFKEEAERASNRLRTELENAGNVLQEQADMSAMVFREKGMLECDLSTAKERIASLDEQLLATSTDYELLRAKMLGLEGALATEVLKVSQGLERETDLEGKRQALEQEIDDAMHMFQGFSEHAEKTLTGCVRREIKMCERGAANVSRLEGELVKVQEDLSDALSQIKRLHGLRDSDAHTARELQCDKENLESKNKFLHECLAKESENSTQLLNANNNLAADLRDARSKGDHSNALLSSAQGEIKQLTIDVSVRNKTCHEQQQQLEALEANIRTLEHNLKISHEQEARTSEQLVLCEASVSDLQLKEMEGAQRLAAAEKARETLSTKNVSLFSQLQQSAVHGRQLLEHVSTLQASLKDNEEYLLDQMFVIEGLRNELSGKCQAVQEMNHAMEAAARDREQLMRTSLQLETLIKYHATNVRKLKVAETTIKELLDGAALAQEEMQGLFMEFSVARGLVERQIGHTVSTLAGYSTQEKTFQPGMQDNLITSLTELEHLRELLDSRRKTQHSAEQEKAEADAERLRSELAQANGLIACLEHDRDRNSDELHVEKEGHQVLSHKLGMSEQRALESELKCTRLRQELARVKGDRDAEKVIIRKAIWEMLQSVREAVGQCGTARNFFTVSHSKLCIFSAAYQSEFAIVAEEIKMVKQAVCDQEQVNTGLKSELAVVRTHSGKMEGELVSLQGSVSSIQSQVKHQVHDLTGILEVAKGDVRQAVWDLEGDCANLTHLALQRGAELDEARRQIVLGKDQVRMIESENDDLRLQLVNVSGLAESRKIELEEMFGRLQYDRQLADDALKATEDAMRTISLLRAELSTTQQARDECNAHATAAQKASETLKVAAEKQLKELRGQLHGHTTGVQERIMALQVESEELHVAISDIYKELGLLRADFRREVGTLNGKVFDYDVHRKRMREAIEHQERELAHREAEVEKITGSLEILMDQLREGDAQQQESRAADQARATDKIEQLQQHIAQRLRASRKLARCMKCWCEHARRKAWAMRAAAALVGRTSSCLQQLVFRRWTRLHSKQRLKIVGKWELLAVGMAVCGLYRPARRQAAGVSRLSRPIGVRKAFSRAPSPSNSLGKGKLHDGNDGSLLTFRSNSSHHSSALSTQPASLNGSSLSQSFDNGAMSTMNRLALNLGLASRRRHQPQPAHNGCPAGATSTSATPSATPTASSLPQPDTASSLDDLSVSIDHLSVSIEDLSVSMRTAVGDSTDRTSRTC